MAETNHAEYAVFYRSRTTTAAGSVFQVFEHKVFKAINKNTTRRLHGEGWELDGVFPERRYNKEEAQELADEKNVEEREKIQSAIRELQRFLSETEIGNTDKV